MSFRLLQLHFAQLLKSWHKSKDNRYSDLRKLEYHKNLHDLVELLKNEEKSFPTLSEPDIQLRTDVINFVFKSLEFLDNSTLNLIPFEIVQCLNAALKDWSDPTENYIIVTSLINSFDFSFDGSFASNHDIYVNIKNLYGVEFKHKLIKINIPEYLSRDYLANVVLYHELGHFVDRINYIAQVVYYEIVEEYFLKASLVATDKTEVEKYFPFMNQPHWSGVLKSGGVIYSLYSHLMEYFCDIFASQYIGDCSKLYLNYITKGDARHSETHPATTNRSEVVDRFLAEDKTSYLINKLVNATKKITKKDLQVRYKQIVSDDFENLVPVDVTSNEELHYLFIYGWNLWKGDWKAVKDNNKFKNDLNGIKVYEIINNLIEKSIGNYVVQTEWKNNVTK